jgi:replicative DNA helicase
MTERQTDAEMDYARVERVVLGCVLLNNSLWNEAQQLREQDFSLTGHQRIFGKMRDLAESSRPIDMVTLADELERHKQIEAVGGIAYLSSLIDGVPERPSIANYVVILREHAFRRASAKTGDALQRMARDGSVSTSAMAEEATRLAAEIGVAADALPPQFSEDALALRFSAATPMICALLTHGGDGYFGMAVDGPKMPRGTCSTKYARFAAPRVQSVQMT